MAWAWVDQRNSVVAVPERCSHFAGERPGHHIAGGARLEKGQQLSFARALNRLCAAPPRSPGPEQKMTPIL